MCAFDRVIKKFHTDQPITAYKIVERVTPDSIGFTIPVGRCPRGRWVRFDEVKARGGCSDFHPGFHAWTQPGWKSRVPGETTMEVALKGDIVIAELDGAELICGEYIYIPTPEEIDSLKLSQGSPGPDEYVEVLEA